MVDMGRIEPSQLLLQSHRIVMRVSVRLGEQATPERPTAEFGRTVHTVQVPLPGQEVVFGCAGPAGLSLVPVEGVYMDLDGQWRVRLWPVEASGTDADGASIELDHGGKVARFSGTTAELLEAMNPAPPLVPLWRHLG